MACTCFCLYRGIAETFLPLIALLMLPYNLSFKSYPQPAIGLVFDLLHILLIERAAKCLVLPQLLSNFDPLYLLTWEMRSSI